MRCLSLDQNFLSRLALNADKNPDIERLRAALVQAVKTEKALCPSHFNETVGESVRLGEIHQQLKETSVGILCLTRENLDARWILFEAGGMAKGMTQNRVCTFLVDVSDTDVKPPLSMFNSTKPNKEDVFKLVQNINRWLDEKKALPEPILKKVFEQNWPEFERDFKLALETHKSKGKPVKRSQEEIIAEILDISRDTQRQLQVTLESTLDLKRKTAQDLYWQSLSKKVTPSDVLQWIVHNQASLPPSSAMTEMLYNYLSKPKLPSEPDTPDEKK